MLALYYYMRKEERNREDQEPQNDEHESNPLDLSDKEFMSKYRLDKETFLHICDILHNDLNHKPHGMSTGLQVLTALRLLGSGSFQKNIGDEQYMQISQPSVSRSLTRVVDALMKVMRQYILFPTTNKEKRNVKEEFYRYSGMPGVLGVIDCIQIEIGKPNVPDCSNYLNRKGRYSINVQLVCDAKGSITNVAARWPGSCSDSYVWEHSGLRDHLETSDHDGYLVGDSGFPLEPWLVKPFVKPANEVEIAFNNSVQNTRKVIEECSRHLKSRFCLLHQLDSVMHYNPQKVCRIITACCVLHNICNARSVELPQDEPIPSMVDMSSLLPLIDLNDEELSLIRLGSQLRNNIALSLYNKSNSMNLDLEGRNENQIDMETQKQYEKNEGDTVREQGSSLSDNIASSFYNGSYSTNENIPDGKENPNEELTLIEQGSRLRDNIAANLYENYIDMDVELS